MSTASNLLAVSNLTTTLSSTLTKQLTSQPYTDPNNPQGIGTVGTLIQGNKRIHNYHTYSPGTTSTTGINVTIPGNTSGVLTFYLNIVQLSGVGGVVTTQSYRVVKVGYYVVNGAAPLFNATRYIDSFFDGIPPPGVMYVTALGVGGSLTNPAFFGIGSSGNTPNPASPVILDCLVELIEVSNLSS